jgi:Aminomethyltransferase folate-binding domain
VKTVSRYILHSPTAMHVTSNVRAVEISISPTETVEIAKLLSQTPVQLTGLGARDSLRLEAGMCLYGQDLDEDTSPVEAGLSWVIGKERREAGGFIGADLVLKHLKDGPPRRRVGFVVEGAPARRKSSPVPSCFIREFDIRRLQRAPRSSNPQLATSSEPSRLESHLQLWRRISPWGTSRTDGTKRVRRLKSK